jgi:hypothetical protein
MYFFMVVAFLGHLYLAPGFSFHYGRGRNQGENGRLTPICVHTDRQGYWTSQSQIGVHLAVTFQLSTVSDSCYHFCSPRYIAYFNGFMKVPRLVLNVLIFVTNFIIEGNLFQACDETETEKKSIGQMFVSDGR